jgi:hypothetical protein
VVGDKPYIENRKNNKIIRVFKSDVDEDSLIWHRDKKNRLVEIIESDKWMFQLDNEFPIELKTGDNLFIPKNIYHRVIKGNGNLIISIIENN